MESLIEVHKKCHKIFSQDLLEGDSNSRTFACKMWDAMTSGDTYHENCLGENFNQLILTIEDDFFGNYTPSLKTKNEFYFTTYILWLYLVVERIDFVFEVININNKSKLFSDFKAKNFETSQKIKKWANFIKHPKEFLFSHWPQYFFETDDFELYDDDQYIKIDSEFVKMNYSKSNKQIKELENCDKVVVMMPDLVQLTQGFCKELNIFFDFICENKIVSDYLRQKTTLEYYYENLREEIEGIEKDLSNPTPF